MPTNKCLSLFAALIVLQIAATGVLIMASFGASGGGGSRDDGGLDDDRARAGAGMTVMAMLRVFRDPGGKAAEAPPIPPGGDANYEVVGGLSSTTTTPQPRRWPGLTVESYVISLTRGGADAFLSRHAGSDGAARGARWFPGVDGMDQSVLDRYADMIGKQPPLDASRFTPEDKADYETPHHVGCFLAHLDLLRSLEGRDAGSRPDLWIVFEDDAMCVPNLTAAVEDVASALPPDWDVLFVGGKPYTQYPEDPSRRERPMNETSFRSEACSGAYGIGHSPLAPDGSRDLSLAQPYWRTLLMTDTFGYVINPRRIGRVLDVIRNPVDYVPVDVMLATAMGDGRLRVYTPAVSLCGCCQSDNAWERGAGVPWEGYHHVPYLTPRNWWGPVSFVECSGHH